MSDFLQSMALSASAMEAQSQRLRHVSENIANADTPGYQRKLVTFREAMGEVPGAIEASRPQLDRTERTRIHDPSHPMADDTGHYLGSNVDMVVEIADAREAQRSYEANLQMLDQARRMTSSLFDLIKR